jgi:uncharacterized protein
MTTEEIHKLISAGTFPEGLSQPELVETHISWILLCNNYVFKIKKPIQYSFLDFSTAEKRKHCCEKEIRLNRRLTNGIYVDVLPVAFLQGQYIIAERPEPGSEIIDFAVRMRKVNRSRQMDVLLLNNKVEKDDIFKLAKKIAAFHKSTAVIYKKDFRQMKIEFNDLEKEKEFLSNNINIDTLQVIDHAIDVSNKFLASHQLHFSKRLKAGFYRDCHGDLHSRNIFLLSEPQPFDCIEFNDEYRHIDVLNEVAFLCMDLEAFNRRDLAVLFIKYYNLFFPAIATKADQQLFLYYKTLRANIRAKVNSLRARSSDNDQKKFYVAEAGKYLKLMDVYSRELLIFEHMTCG